MRRVFQNAIVRPPGKSLLQGISSADLGSTVVYETAIVQHQQYCDALEACGLAVTKLPVLEDYADSCFVEDVSICTPKMAVMLNPGDARRVGEVDGMLSSIQKHYNGHVHAIMGPGTVDGGDVMEVDEHYYIGISKRTNEPGAAQLISYLQDYGYSASMIPVDSKYLHLKTGMTYLTNSLMVTTPEMNAFVDKKMDRVVVTTEEAAAANCMCINDTILIPSGFPRIEHEFQKRGLTVIPVDTSEIQKVNGGLTCLSLRF